ncbi:MAG: DUF2225 domain-containing protein [Chitinophagaceae bacterium]|nr:DUF2225 domain-containing protein [Chitinophagaceae bacterium]
MKEHLEHNHEQLNELLKKYSYLKKGLSNVYIDEESFELIISYFEDREDLEKAMEATETALLRFPYSAQLLLRKADLLISFRKYKEALEVLDKAEIFDNSDILLYILKTEVFLAMDKPERAVKVLEKALTIFEGEDKLELLFELADVYDDYEDFDKVFDCLAMILKEDPENEEALYKICFWADFTGRYEESIKIHEEVINQSPYNKLAWFNLGSAFMGIKLYEKAIDAYKYALVIDEKFDFAYRNMANCYIRLKNYKEAIDALETVLEISQPEYLVYEVLAHCYEKLDYYAQARFYYRKASHLKPEDSRWYYKIAYTYFKEQQWEKCLKTLMPALQQQRRRPEYLLLAGECCMRLGLFKEAYQYLSVLIHLRPKNIKGWESLIRCIYRAGIYEEGLFLIREALKITQYNPLFLYYESVFLFVLNQKDKALQILKEAVRKSPRRIKKIFDLEPTLAENPSIQQVLSELKKKS